MSSSKHENTPNSGEQADIVALTNAYLESLPDDPACRRCIAEGDDISSIVAALGLPPKLLAAVRVYPLVRDKIVNINTFDNNGLSDLSRIVIDLNQLSGFDLPSGFQ